VSSSTRLRRELFLLETCFALLATTDVRARIRASVGKHWPTCEDLFKDSFGIFFADAMAAIAPGPAPGQLLRSSRQTHCGILPVCLCRNIPPISVWKGCGVYRCLKVSSVVQLSC
jgi:hypothetical protein